MSDAELTRLLSTRAPGYRYRFVFDGVRQPGLRLVQVRPRAADRGARDETGDAIVGAVLVEDDFRVVFCGQHDPADLLARIVGWARDATPGTPAVAALVGAGAARIDAAVVNDEAVRAIELDRLTIYRDKAVWTGLARADHASVAAVLGGCLPGERLWFWMTDAPGKSGPPLLVQSVVSDPNRDYMNALIDVAEADGARRPKTGIVYATEDGILQFISPHLDAALLPVLADWVRRNMAEHPALRRLVGCRLVRAALGRAAEVIEQPALWDGIDRWPGPATSAETDTILAGLRPGAECWFWLTGTAPSGIFLSLSAVIDDPDGSAFAARAAGLYRRFPKSHVDAVAGVLRCLGGGSLVFTTQGVDVAQWPVLRQRLAKRHAAAAPAIAAAELEAVEAT
ncbi:MAG: hypothetical protein HIU82_05510 [Proteobacteria bacterium]|nr:hypothetical protein [Pseudomonadota bacterium]